MWVLVEGGGEGGGVGVGGGGGKGEGEGEGGRMGKGNSEGKGGGKGLQRRILASCETIRRRAFVGGGGNGDGGVREGVVHGVASVFCKEEYRGRGYASRMMRELNGILRGCREWRRSWFRCVLELSCRG